MYFLLIAIILIFLIEGLIKIYQPNIAKNEKKMRLIRSIELTIFSPFLAIGIILLKGENVEDNLWFVAVLMVGFFGFAVQNYCIYKKDSG